MCDATYLREHERLLKGGLLCSCGEFVLVDENDYCYHCFARRAGLDGCHICELEKRLMV
jgi:hypothetical protein